MKNDVPYVIRSVKRFARSVQNRAPESQKKLFNTLLWSPPASRGPTCEQPSWDIRVALNFFLDFLQRPSSTLSNYLACVIFTARFDAGIVILTTRLIVLRSISVFLLTPPNILRNHQREFQSCWFSHLYHHMKYSPFVHDTPLNKNPFATYGILPNRVCIKGFHQLAKEAQHMGSQKVITHVYRLPQYRHCPRHLDGYEGGIHQRSAPGVALLINQLRSAIEEIVLSHLGTPLNQLNG